MKFRDRIKTEEFKEWIDDLEYAAWISVIILSVLKLTGVISASWWIVTFPLIGPYFLILSIWAGLAMLAFILSIIVSMLK